MDTLSQMPADILVALIIVVALASMLGSLMAEIVRLVVRFVVWCYWIAADLVEILKDKATQRSRDALIRQKMSIDARLNRCGVASGSGTRSKS